MDISKNLKEGILEANNKSTTLEVGPEYTTFISETGKTRYPTDAVRGVTEYIAGRLPVDADPVMAIGYNLNRMKIFYHKLTEGTKEPRPKKLEYLV